MQMPPAPARQLLLLPLLMLLALIPLNSQGWRFEGGIAACFSGKHLPSQSTGILAQIVVSNRA
jgi:hypothetical protein